METLGLSLLGGFLGALITLLLVYLGPLRGLGVAAFMVIMVLTALTPFLSYLLLVLFKPIVDSLYHVKFSFLKLTHLFSVYSVAIWGMFIVLKRSLRNPMTSMDLSHFLLLLPIPAILLFSPNIGGVDLALRVLSGWGFYFMAREIDLKNARWIEVAFLLSVMFPVITGLLSVWGYIPNGFQEGSFERLKGPYHDATAFGFEIVPGFLILLHRLGRKFNILEFGLTVVIIYLFYRTYTRVLWVSVALASGIMAFRSQSKGGRLPLLLLLLVLVGGGVFLYPEISARFSQHGLGTDPDSFNGRMLIWSEGFKRFFALNPLAMFFGLITTGKPMGLYLHNTYLVFLVDMGIFGFTVFLAWMFNVIRFTSSCKGTYAGLLKASLVFVLVSGITSGGILYPNFQWFFLTILGLSMNDRLSRMRASSV